MVRQKGFHLLVEAVERLPTQSRERIHVTIGGDGEEREGLMRITREKNLEKYISHPGWLSKEDFWKQLAAHDIFVLPRWRIEMPSIIVMEAVALGIPALVPGGGAVEWMTGNAAATFIDSNVESLSRTLARIIDSPEERKRLSENAKARWEVLHYRPRSRVLWDMLEVASRNT
jgi:glycosyltransferase involved in cell wall biosynthesis